MLLLNHLRHHHFWFIINIFANFPVAPYCKPDQVQVFGVAREETARISCEVIANPQTYVYFEWRFNTTGEMVDMPHDRFR